MAQNEFYVGDEYRKNDLSFTPGGFDVEIFDHRGKSAIYSKVKSPWHFWKKSKLDDPTLKFYRVLGPTKK